MGAEPNTVSHAAAREPVSIVFDGVCVICNAGCRFVAKRDREGRFRYVSIQSPEGRPLAQSLGIDPDDPLKEAA